MINGNPRLQPIQESSTLALNAQANKMRTQGVDVINLTAGEPDFPTPGHIVAAANLALKEGKTRYLPTAGLSELRQAVAKVSSKDYGYEITPNQVLITNGAKHALYNIFTALLQPDDEVILPAPYWLSYPPMIELCGATTVVLPSQSKGDLAIDIDMLAKRLSPRTRAIVINSPSNPAGSLQSQETLQAIANLVAKRNIYLIFDDIYQKIIFDHGPWISPYSLQGISPDHIIIANGVSKAYAMTGFRIGWVITSTAWIERLTALQSHTTSSPATPSQWAALAALSGEQKSVASMSQTYLQRRNLVMSALQNIPDLKVPQIGGAFYAFPDVSAYLGGQYRDSHSLAQHLLHEAHIALVPGNDFGAPNHLRLSFATSEKNLSQGIERLATALKKLKG